MNAITILAVALCAIDLQAKDFPALAATLRPIEPAARELILDEAEAILAEENKRGDA